jgi:hypothetical protein
MNRLRALTPEELTVAEARLRSPAQGSRIEAAREFGIDLGLIVQQLRLSPTERARQMEEYARVIETIRGAAGLSRMLPMCYNSDE